MVSVSSNHAAGASAVHLVTAKLVLFLLLLSPSLLLSEAGHVLYNSGALNRKESLSYGDYKLTLQDNCNLVLTDGGKVVWAVNTPRPVSDCNCNLLMNGELVLFDDIGKRVWATNKTGPWGDYVLLLTKNGNLVIAGPVRWSTKRQVETRLNPTDGNIGADNVLIRGATLYPGNYLMNGDWELKMQSDCNLVLYEKHCFWWCWFDRIWSTNTTGNGKDCRLKLQNDGDLVISDPRGKRIWGTNTKGDGANFALILQNNGNLVLYGPSIWAGGTNTTIPLLSVVATI